MEGREAPLGGLRPAALLTPQQPWQELTLCLAVVHAVLAGQRLDEVLEGCVAAHIVADADCLLHPQQHAGEGWVERLQVVSQLSHHGPQPSLCSDSGRQCRCWHQDIVASGAAEQPSRICMCRPPCHQ